DHGGSTRGRCHRTEGVRPGRHRARHRVVPAVTGDGPLASLREVTCDLGHGPVLQDITLEIQPGSFTGIVGPSGSGKTTLLRTLLTSIAPETGEVTRRSELRVAYVPQVETIDWDFPVTVAEVLHMARPGRRFRPWPDA